MYFLFCGSLFNFWKMKDKKNYNQEIIDLVGDEAIEADIAELRAIKEEKVRRMDREAYRFYEPNGKCEEFIKAVGDGSKCGGKLFVSWSE
jgi:hypothetical protein